MAKSVAKKIKKLKRSKEYKILTTVIVLLIAAIGYFFYSDQGETPTYSSSQNADGYYYYVSSTNHTDYYYDANNLTDTQLEDKLYDIISNNFQPVSYNDARQILAESDKSLDDPTKIWNIYDGKLVEASWDAGTSWNREHVWPNSRLGMDRVDGTDKNQASDLHNLRAATPSVNSSRSDRFYSDGSGEYSITDDQGFYPGDEHIGDVARILFYMIVMYDYLELTDDLNALLDESDHYTMDGARMGILADLIEWHKLDPVDDFERQRNDVIYEAQGNRNPFIDHPEYVHLIWENKTVSDLMPPADDTTDQETAFVFILAESKRYDLNEAII